MKGGFRTETIRAKCMHARASLVMIRVPYGGCVCLCSSTGCVDGSSDKRGELKGDISMKGCLLKLSTCIERKKHRWNCIHTQVDSLNSFGTASRETSANKLHSFTYRSSQKGNPTGISSRRQLHRASVSRRAHLAPRRRRLSRRRLARPALAQLPLEAGHDRPQSLDL